MSKGKEASLKFSKQGNSLAKEIFREQVRNDRVANVYLISGPRGIDKESIVEDLIKIIRCASESEKPCGKCHYCKLADKGSQSDPDLSIVEPDEKGSLKIEKMRELKKKASFKKVVDVKIFWLKDAHTLTRQAANSILKVLEDSAQRGKEMIFFLTSDNLNLPETIISRAQVITLTPNIRKTSKEKLETSPGRAIAASGLDKSLAEYKGNKANKKKIDKYYKSYQYLKKAKISDRLKYVNEKLVKFSVPDLIEYWLLFERYSLLTNYTKSSQDNLKLLINLSRFVDHSINKKILLKKAALSLKT